MHAGPTGHVREFLLAQRAGGSQVDIQLLDAPARSIPDLLLLVIGQLDGQFVSSHSVASCSSFGRHCGSRIWPRLSGRVRVARDTTPLLPQPALVFAEGD